jgi:hypothetical protein
MEDAEYQRQYNEALEALDQGKPIPVVEEPAKAEAPALEKVKPEEPKQEEKPAEVDPLEEIRQKLEKTEKALKDTQAWGTKNAQELATIRREREEREREAARPTILDANPELEAAIKHVTSAPVQKQPDHQKEWVQIVEAAHPGIFDTSIEPELEAALMTRLQALGEQVNDPLVAIREITAEKIAHTERQIGKRFAAEAAKGAQKSAMNVPGAGASGARTAQPDADLEAKNRILNMSSAEFEKERRKVLGY